MKQGQEDKYDRDSECKQKFRRSEGCGQHHRQNRGRACIRAHRNQRRRKIHIDAADVRRDEAGSGEDNRGRRSCVR